jgi:hypothetical protein
MRWWKDCSLSVPHSLFKLINCGRHFYHQIIFPHPTCGTKQIIVINPVCLNQIVNAFCMLSCLTKIAGVLAGKLLKSACAIRQVARSQRISLHLLARM